MPRRGAAGKGLDYQHAAAATWTSKRALRRVAICGIIASMLSLRLCHGKEFAGARDVVGTRRFGEQAEVADAVKPLRQDMDEEAADEFVR